MPDKGARPFIDAAVEGMTDEAVVRRLIDHAGGQVGTVCIMVVATTLVENETFM